MSQPTKFEDIPCCPPLDTSPVCDVIDMRRRLVFPTKVRAVNARGSHNAQSASDYLREHHAHAESSDHQSVEATRKAHSLSVGEVSTRTHTQGESEEHFESSSRSFSNPNQCHAVTFLFYRINKTETLKLELLSLERRVIDPVAALPVPANPIRSIGQVSPIHQEVPATNK